jgi:hypothetical protein
MDCRIGDPYIQQKCKYQLEKMGNAILFYNGYVTLNCNHGTTVYLNTAKAYECRTQQQVLLNQLSFAPIANS